MNMKAAGEDVDDEEIAASGKKGKGRKTAYDRELKVEEEKTESKKRGREEEEEPDAKKLRVAEDSKGRRVLDRDSVVREMWVAGGSVHFKELMKAFSITSKSKRDRLEAFKAILKEVSVKKGEVFTLKQHFVPTK
jgi:hypothetical protein